MNPPGRGALHMSFRVAASSAAWGWLDASVLAIPKAFGLEAATRTEELSKINQYEDILN
jgi:hypothetical protein